MELGSIIGSIIGVSGVLTGFILKARFDKRIEAQRRLERHHEKRKDTLSQILPHLFEAMKDANTRDYLEKPRTTTDLAKDVELRRQYVEDHNKWERASSDEITEAVRLASIYGKLPYGDHLKSLWLYEHIQGWGSNLFKREGDSGYVKRSTDNLADDIKALIEYEEMRLRDLGTPSYESLTRYGLPVFKRIGMGKNEVKDEWLDRLPCNGVEHCPALESEPATKAVVVDRQNPVKGAQALPEGAVSPDVTG